MQSTSNSINSPGVVYVPVVISVTGSEKHVPADTSTQNAAHSALSPRRLVVSGASKEPLQNPSVVPSNV